MWASRYSGDDWFITKHQLLVTETTNEIFNKTLYTHLTAHTVPYWVRVQIANDAASAPEWHLLFERFNNGGYNNQWMVIDYKLFRSGQALAPNTLVVGEQAPGLYVFDDQTAFLSRTGYWASYNVPFYPQIWEYSGYPEMYRRFGNPFSWSQCARARIYRRDQPAVQSLDGLKRIQRYNQWQTDPESLQDACRGISARCDLNSPWQNGTMNGFAAFGAVDGKVTDESLVKAMISHAVQGPTWLQQHIFHWSETWQSIPTLELPRAYAFDWVEMKD